MLTKQLSNYIHILSNSSSHANTVILSSCELLNYVIAGLTHMLLEENIIGGEYFLILKIREENMIGYRNLIK